MMRLLLDTHVVLWWLDGSDRLSDMSKAAIADGRNEAFVSAVTIWEIAIKRPLGKLVLPDDWYSVLSDEPFEHLPITWEHASLVQHLPLHHRDPFDRLLVAQAMAEHLTLVSHDAIIQRYDIDVLET